MRRWLFLALGTMVPTTAFADGSVGLRITDEGLDWIADQALAKVPTEMDLDDVEMPIMDCWPRDSVLEVWQGHVDIEHLDLDFPFSDDEVGIVVDAGAHVTGTVLLDAIACLPLSVSCDMDVTVNRALATASVGVASGPDGRVDAGLGDVTLAILPEDLDIEFSNCTGEIDDRLDDLYDQAEPMLLDMIQEQLQTWIDENVRPQVDALIGQTMSFPIEGQGLEVSVSASGIERQNRALLMGASLGLRATEVSDCIVPNGEVELSPDGGLSFTEWEPSPFALGISERVIDEALYATWQAGSMCFPAKDLSGFAGLVEGIPEGIDMQLTFQLGAPPDVDVQPDGIHVALPGVSAILDMVTADGPVQAVFEGGASAMAVLELDPATNGLHLHTTHLEITDMELTAGELPEGVELRAVVDGLVFPLILDYVGNARIADGVLPVSDYWVIVNAIDYYDGAAAMAFELFVTPDDDNGRPDTLLVQGQEEPVEPGTPVTVQVGGRDDRVPERLLRYSMQRPDETEWTEPDFAPSFTLRQYGDGEWVYKVRAVDLAGNVDDEPLKITLTIESAPDLSHPDALPPPDDDVPDDGAGPTGEPIDETGGCSCRQAPAVPTSSPIPGIAMAVILAVVSLTRRRPRG